MNRKTEFLIGEYYHIYNRGVEKRNVFSAVKDYERFLLSMWLMNDEQDGLMDQWRQHNVKVSPSRFKKDYLQREKPLVEIICYCLNPNHYHFILKQVSEKGIENFMQKIGTGYTMYFNKKYKRSGALFQGVFKSIHIDSNEYLLYLSAYVNENNFIHRYGKKSSWKYSSCGEYSGKLEEEICSKEMILGQFRSKKDYREYLAKNSRHLKEKKRMEKYLLESSG